MRMLTFFINRAGRNLSLARRRELERAKRLLSQRIHQVKILALSQKSPEGWGNPFYFG